MSKIHAMLNDLMFDNDNFNAAEHREDRNLYRLDVRRDLAKIEEYVDGLERELTQLRDAARWIPVEERLPERFRPALVTLTVPNGATVAMAETVELQNGSIVWHNRMGSIISDDCVLAWRPLPEPYDPEA